MTKLWQLGAAELVQGYQAKQFSPVQVTNACIERAQSHAEPLNALCQTRYELALDEARGAEQRYFAGQPLGPLDGVPCTIKVCIDTEGHINTQGSQLLINAPAAKTNAPAAERLLATGAIMLAKTAMPDFGMAGSGASSLYGNCGNPYQPSLNTSGSSSGSAVALAVGACAISLGTDQCGSIRNPAAWTGVVGFKQSYGRVPHNAAKYGHYVGPMARNVADARLVYRNINGPHEADPLALPSTPSEVPDARLKGLKVGLLVNGVGMPTVDPQVEAHVQATAELLTTAGAQVIDLSALDIWQRCMNTWIQYLGFIALPWLQKYKHHNASQIPMSMYQWVKASAPTTALASANLMADLYQCRAELHALSQEYDFILSPTLSHKPFAADLYGPENLAERNIEHLWYTGIYNLGGQPAISIPAGFDDQGIPVGIQLAAPLYQDERLLAVAQIVEGLLDFDNSTPLA